MHLEYGVPKVGRKVKAFHYSQCGKITAYSADLALKTLLLVGIGIQITDVVLNFSLQ